jgi:murein DD-endopeptidase MepM/ murein hydrolase activator NlpD
MFVVPQRVPPMRAAIVVAGVVAGVIGGAPCAPNAQAQLPPSVEFRVPKPPTVAVSDSGAFLVYELHVTNLTASPLTLRRVEVLAVDGGTAGRVVSDLSDSALLRATARVGSPVPVAERMRIGGGLRAYVYLWIPTDANRPPAQLTHRLTFTRGSSDTTDVLRGTTISVDPRAVAIGPPVHGEWAAFNGPSNSSGHRRLVLGLDGHTAIGQRFAIDFLRLDSTGKSYRGDPLKNSNYYAYGTPLLAVADGIVVETKDSIPENVPGANSRAVTIDLVTVGGNHVALDIGGGKYALYAHVQPGSLKVKPGDRVKRGQVLALLGNSGNSTEPHVHFQIADGPTFLSSEGVPYATDFEVVGGCAINMGPPPAFQCSRRAPTAVKDGIPLQNEIVRFP